MRSRRRSSARSRPPIAAIEVIAVLTVGLLLTVILPPRPVRAAPADASPVLPLAPAAGEVVAAGSVVITARVEGASPGDVGMEIDGVPVGHRSTADGGNTLLTAERAPAPGPHEVTVRATVDGTAVERTWPFAVSPIEVARVAGADRIGTAVDVADAVAAGDRVPAAVLVRADGFADALAGGVLAHVSDGILLLTPGDALAAEVEEALGRLVASGGVVYVLGGRRAIGEEVAARAADLGRRVVRLGGDDRYATAAEVAREVSRLAPVAGDESVGAVIASGNAFTDALAMSVPAAREGWPVLLTDRDGLPPATRAALLERGVDRVEVAGGSAAVSAGVADTIRGLPTGADVVVRRTGGEDRYATAAAIAARFLPNERVSLASGRAAADALAGSVLAAARGTPLLLTDHRLPAETASMLSALAVERLLVFGGPEAVRPRAVHDALRDRVDDPGLSASMTPSAGATLDVQDLPVIEIRAGVPLDPSSAGSFSVDGRQAPVRSSVDGGVLTLEILSLPRDLEAYEVATARLRAGLRTRDGDLLHADTDYTVVHRPPLVTSQEGWQGIGAEGAIAGSAGPVRRYSLEVEPATGVDPHAFAERAEAILGDPRGWTADGSVRLQRVAPADADIRVLLARPQTVDGLCAKVGLDTGGVYSCWTGGVAALNLDRWNIGATPFEAPLDVYRGYLVNHEVGHGLGHGHRSCPGPGALAPVMMQQTKGTGACEPNAWPFP